MVDATAMMILARGDRSWPGWSYFEWLNYPPGHNHKRGAHVQVGSGSCADCGCGGIDSCARCRRPAADGALIWSLCRRYRRSPGRLLLVRGMGGGGRAAVAWAE